MHSHFNEVCKLLRLKIFKKSYLNKFNILNKIVTHAKKITTTSFLCLFWRNFIFYKIYPTLSTMFFLLFCLIFPHFYSFPHFYLFSHFYPFFIFFISKWGEKKKKMQKMQKIETRFYISMLLNKSIIRCSFVGITTSSQKIH